MAENTSQKEKQSQEERQKVGDYQVQELEQTV